MTLPGCGLGGPSYRRGVNAAGADFGVDARFDSDASFAWYAARGHRLVRLPFLWESVQPEPGQALDASYVSRLHDAVGAVTSRGMTCVLDVHNYGRHSGRAIGEDGLDSGHLADLWVRLVEDLRTEEPPAPAGATAPAGSAGGGASAGPDGPVEAGDVELGLMNEPHDMPGGAEAWEDTVQEVVTAVRDAGSTSWVWVAGEQWSSAATWAETHPDWWVEDPLDRSGPEGHYYFDAGNQRRGTYPHPYAVDEAAAVSQGYENLLDKVRTELGGFVAYCARHDVRGLLGEMGWPHGGPSAAHPEDAARWAALGEAAYQVLDDGGLDVTAWAAGEQWGTDYNLSVYTGTPQDTLTEVAVVVEGHPTVG